MELEGLILLFVIEISRCFVAFERKLVRHAVGQFFALTEVLNKIQQIYPEKFEGELKKFGLFTIPTGRKENCSEYEIRARLTGQYASANALSFFKKKWPKLLNELYHPKTTVLQIDGVTAIQKIYSLMKSCSDFYHSMELHAIHYGFCCHYERHSRYGVYLYLCYVYQVFRIMSTKTRSRDALKVLLSLYPCYRKVIQMRKNKITHNA